MNYRSRFRVAAPALILAVLALVGLVSPAGAAPLPADAPAGAPVPADCAAQPIGPAVSGGTAFFEVDIQCDFVPSFANISVQLRTDLGLVASNSVNCSGRTRCSAFAAAQCQPGNRYQGSGEVLYRRPDGSLQRIAGTVPPVTGIVLC